MCIRDRKTPEELQKFREYERQRVRRWYQEHTEEKKSYCKQYHQEHKEAIQARHKQYYQEHKADRQAYEKEYYEKKKEQIALKRSEKFNCDICGGKYTLGNKPTHAKTIKNREALADATTFSLS